MPHLIRGHNFLVLGRIGMDLYPEEGAKIAQAGLMRAALGGSSGNIAAGLARLGGRVEILSMVSNDPVGAFVREQCASYGIGTRYLGLADKGSNTSLALAENRLDDFEAVLYRNQAADLMLDEAMIATVDFAEFDALVVTGTALSAEPSRTATLIAMQQARLSVLDLDYRIAAWIKEAPAPIYRQAMQLADMVIGNDEEFALLGGLQAAREFGQEKIAIYKMGEKGAMAIHQGEEFTMPVFTVKALKPVGAGDAFMAGFLMGLANGNGLKQAVRMGAANAALVVSRPACAPAMATFDELNQFLNERMK